MLLEICMVLIGIFAGVITGLTGASGVMIIVPLLNIVLGISVHKAIGVSLIVDVIASIVVTYVYKEYGNTALNPGIWMALGSILGAQLGASTVKFMSGGLLGLVFGISMIIMGYYILKKGLNKEYIVKNIAKKFYLRDNRKRIYIAIILGFIIGIITGIIGAGGGMMFFLVLIIILAYPIHLAIGTSTLIMAITALSGALGYAYHGNTDILVATIVGVGAVIGGISSARFANKIDEESLSKAVGLIFIILGLLMIISRILIYIYKV